MSEPIVTCELDQYVEKTIGPFKLLDDILIGDAGRICQNCQFLMDCKPGLTQTCNGVLLLTQAEAQASY